MSEPTLGELVKMQEEVGAAKRMRHAIKKSDTTDTANYNGNCDKPRQQRSYPPFRESSSDTPREEPATLRKWKEKYGSRYSTAMQYRPSNEPFVPKTPRRRDPRFDPRCGEYIPEVFRSNFSFVKDMRHNEVDAMKKEVSKISHQLSSKELSQQEVKEKLTKQRQLKQMVKSAKNRLVSEELRVDQYRLINEVKRKEALESAKEGRHPHFMNRSELKQLKLVSQFRQLKDSGEIDKYLDRKRRKAAQGSRRFRPE